MGPIRRADGVTVCFANNVHKDGKRVEIFVAEEESDAFLQFVFACLRAFRVPVKWLKLEQFSFKDYKLSHYSKDDLKSEGDYS